MYEGRRVKESFLLFASDFVILTENNIASAQQWQCCAEAMLILDDHRCKYNDSFLYPETRFLQTSYSYQTTDKLEFRFAGMEFDECCLLDLK
jgi:hypothetical protein